MKSARFSRLGPSRAVVRRERMLILGGGTLVFSLVIIAAMLIYSQSPAEAGKQVTGNNEVNDDIAYNTVVLIAPTVPVQPGTKLSKVSMREMYWPRDKVPEGAIRDVSDLNNMYAKAKLPANQPIVRDNLSATPPSIGIGDLLPPGHRAVTIEVDATSGVEGWATPGAHVDVLLTYRDQADGMQKTRVAIEDAVVLSFDGSTKKVGVSDGAAVAPRPRRASSTVTLAVTYDDSLKIQTARAMGRITLALRNPTDVKSMGAEVFSSNEFGKDNNSNNRDNGRAIAPKGYARFKDKNGMEHELELDGDSRWWKVEGFEG